MVTWILVLASLGGHCFADGPDGYRSSLHQMVERFAGGELALSAVPADLRLDSVVTENAPAFLGILARTQSRERPEAILALLRDESKFAEIYPELYRAAITHRDPTSDVVDWIYRGPMGIKTRYTTRQEAKMVTPERGFFLYSLEDSPDVLVASGAILVERQGEITRFISIDFFNAKWGFLAKLFRERLWVDSCRATATTTRVLTGARAIPGACVGFAPGPGTRNWEQWQRELFR